MTARKKLEISNKRPKSEPNGQNEIIIPELEEAMATFVPRASWTEREEAILRRYWGKVPVRMLETTLKHSLPSIRTKVQNMGLRKEG